MNNNDSPVLQRMHRIVKSLGAVWMVDFEDEDLSILEPGGPFFSDDEIDQVEREIGFKLPLEYRLFLKHYGCPEFLGYKLMAIYPGGNKDELPPSDDMARHYFMNVESGFLKPGEISFLTTDENGTFFYRCQPFDSNEESPSSVYRVVGNDENPECVAPSMMDLFARWVVESDGGN